MGSHHQPATWTGVGVAWFGWFVSHLEQINPLLQFGVLCVSLIASLIAIRKALK